MREKIRYVSIIALAITLCMVLHMSIPVELATETSADDLSIVAAWLGFPLTALLWASIAYSCVALVFHFTRISVSENRAIWEMKFGIFIGVLWLLGYVMAMPKFGNSFYKELAGGLCDAIPVVVMVALLGRFTNSANKGRCCKRKPFIGIVVFGTVFFVIRMMAYHINAIDIGFWINSMYSSLWTIAMGIFLGVLYVILGETMAMPSVAGSAVKFGCFLFGVTWGSFILFFPLMLKGQLLNTVFMGFLDMLAVVISYYCSEKLHHVLNSSKFCR
ncbi:hypothetical protein [Anaeromusa sp.]|uniref:hypothetical protein n=1 Tax=Anaeromusa sp. TaxID=1872520 RepID=UPI0026252DF2|nr:hypothetical protein [Anaeromusa sp.]MDD3157128.1 hypothetical protein [Anaeromusa sp.]